MATAGSSTAIKTESSSTTSVPTVSSSLTGVAATLAISNATDAKNEDPRLTLVKNAIAQNPVLSQSYIWKEYLAKLDPNKITGVDGKPTHVRDPESRKWIPIEKLADYQVPYKSSWGPNGPSR